MKSLSDFLQVDKSDVAYELNVDAIDPKDTFRYGPSEPFTGAHSVTAYKPESNARTLDWQRITVWFEWSSGAPRIFAISTWGWTP